MKPETPDLELLAARRKAARDKEDARPWHPSVIEFSKGVEVCEDTMPAELWDLFKPQGEASGNGSR